MKESDWQKVKSIFNSALDMPPQDRAAYLDDACAGDEALRIEVEKLLGAYRSEFMEVAAEETDTRRLEPGTKLNRYEIVNLLGSGGMGEVYLAKDAQLDRKVAIKVLTEKYESSEANVRRFIKEAKAASALNHPNILTIHEIGQEDNSHYIVSEYIEGHTLRTIIERDSLSIRQVLEIAIQIASALAAAHSARIIHRDIKPENIVLRNDGYVKVLDFGLAKLIPQFNGLDGETLTQNQTSEGLILGTVRYMSPEQARAGKVDERTDIFSLGVLLYEMIAGGTPFGGDSTLDVFASLVNKDPEPLSRFARDVPDELERIVSKTLRKNPDERYQTMKGLVADLKELKERITVEDKISRELRPEGTAVTGVLQKTTGDVAGTTSESVSAPASWYRWPTLVGISALLLTALAAVLYLRWTGDQPQHQIKSLAVLPLKSLDAGENYLGLGIADALIRRISQTGALTVRPTSAVRRYLNEDTDAISAARELAADAVLEGSVQRANDRLRVSVNLLRTGDGASLWADSFDTREADIFAIQDSVAQQIASRLRLHLNPDQVASLGKRVTDNPLAYEYYVKGVYNFDLRGLGEKAKPHAEATVEFFKKAIQEDPNFALAHSQLAYVYAWLAVLIEPSNDVWRQRAEEEIAIATRIDQQIAETHIARGMLLSSAHYGWQAEATIRELLEAQRLNPNAAHTDLAGEYYHIGLDDLTDREYRKALEIDPTSNWTKMDIRYYYINYRRYDDYATAAQNFIPGEPLWAQYYIGKGLFAEAQTAIEKELILDPTDPYTLSDKAKLLALKGNAQEAEALIAGILEGRDRRNRTYHHLVYEVACNYALLGKSAQAVEHLREAVATGYCPYTLFERDQYLNPIRNSPEFIQFMADMKPVYERRRNEFR